MHGQIMSQQSRKASAKNSSVRSSASSRGKRQVEQIKNRLAVRYRDGAGQKLHRLLAQLGTVKEVKPKRLLIIAFPDAAHREMAIKQLDQWEKEGLVKYVTPVLRDVESKAMRIPTDEITVRFKSPLPDQKLKTFEEKHGVTIARQNEFVPTQFIVKVENPEGLHTLEVAKKLDSLDEVAFAEPNYISEYRR